MDLVEGQDMHLWILQLLVPGKKVQESSDGCNSLVNHISDSFWILRIRRVDLRLFINLLQNPCSVLIGSCAGKGHWAKNESSDTKSQI